MHTKRGIKRSRRTGALLGAAGTLAGAVYGVMGTPSHANAAAIDVALANFSTTTTTGNATNAGINPITYTPTQVTIPYAPTTSYDAADTTDSGTIWNSLQSVSTVPTVASVGVTNVLYEQSIPLVDSSGSSTGVTLNVSAIESNGKSDAIHTGHNDANAAGTGVNGSLPSNPAYPTSLDGYGTDAGAAHLELMNTAWVANGAAEGVSFSLMGLTPNGSYNLYVYGAGSVAGQGAKFTLAAANGGTSASTNSDTGNAYRSVFGPDGISPGPEQGLSWNLLQATADSSGTITFTALSSDTVKPSIDGFQIDAAVVPEPTSAGLLGLSMIAILGRRRRGATTA